MRGIQSHSGLETGRFARIRNSGSSSPFLYKAGLLYQHSQLTPGKTRNTGLLLVGTCGLQRSRRKQLSQCKAILAWAKYRPPLVRQKIFKRLPLLSRMNQISTRYPPLQHCLWRGYARWGQTWIAEYEYPMKKSKPARDDGQCKLWKWSDWRTQD